MQRAQYVLLDFDGPICDVFAGFPAPEVADRLRVMLKAAGAELPQSVLEQDDPMEVFRFSADLGSNLNHVTLNTLTDLEVEAVATARLTPGVADLIRQSKQINKIVAVVSNNSVAAVTAFLQAHELLPSVDLISARVQGPGVDSLCPVLSWLIRCRRRRRRRCGRGGRGGRGRCWRVRPGGGC